VHKRNLFRVQKGEKCQWKTLTELLNTLRESLCKECIEQAQGACMKVFLENIISLMSFEILDKCNECT
jgi:hypothetical protein